MSLSTSRHFSGNPLNRSAIAKKDQNFLVAVLQKGDAKVVVVTGLRGKKVLCSRRDNSPLFSLCYFPATHILNSVLNLDAQSCTEKYTVVLLGQSNEDASWYVAIDIIDFNLETMNISSTSLFQHDQSFTFLDGRQMLVKLPIEDLAIAGQALALCSWHANNLFDGVVGKPTRSIEGGAKRGTAHGTKVYPRTDPVVIVAVLSPDKSKILLGNMKAMMSNFYSCLSGFVEPCESVCEAAVREVWEESGVCINPRDVQLVDSQPWPIGRGGGCELMLGCVAIASSTDISIHDELVNDVKWFNLDDVQQLICDADRDAYKAMEYRQQLGKPFIPGQYALAYHLIKRARDDLLLSQGSNTANKVTPLLQNTGETPSLHPLTLSLICSFAFFGISLLHTAITTTLTN